MSGPGMNCTEAKRYLDLFLDGELSVEQNLKVLEHLNLCTCCSKTFDGEKLLAAEMCKTLDEKCPETLKQRCCQALQKEQRPRDRMLLAIAAVLLVGVGIGVVASRLYPAKTQPPPQVAIDPMPSSELARTLAVRHEEGRQGSRSHGVCVCPECTSQPEQDLESFFASNGRKACFHCLKDAGYVWKSGDIWKDGVKGRWICMTVQVARSRGVVVSQASVPRAEILFEGGREAQWGNHPVRVYHEGGRVIIMGVCGNDYVCVFVVDSMDEAKRIGVTF